MAAKKGHIKSGGRAAGTPNRATSDIRTFVKNMLDDNMYKLQADFDSLEPKDRLMMFERLLQYVIPKKREEEIVENVHDERIRRLFSVENN